MCGIVGIYHKKEPACGDVYDALIQVQHRGQDAAGISTWDTEKILTHKYTGLVTEVFKHQLNPFSLQIQLTFPWPTMAH